MDLFESPKPQSIHLKNIYLDGVHNRYKLEVDFFESLSILHGQNGTGKTTLIHAIANVANCDFLRFAFLEFTVVRVNYSNGNWVSITRNNDGAEYKVNCASGGVFSFNKPQAIEALSRHEDDRFGRDYVPELIEEQERFCKENDLQLVKTSYFPAFRTILEAWSAQLEEDRFPGARSRSNVTSKKITNFSRNLFGRFLPVINFPSPLDIEDSLRNEIRDAQIKIGRYDSTVFTESFVKVFSALLSGDQGCNEDAEKVLHEISDLANTSPGESILEIEGPTQATYQKLQYLIKSGEKAKELASSAVGALTVYRDALRERRNFQERIFSEIDKYFNAVNGFLDKDRKELKYHIDPARRLPKVGLRFPDNTWSSIRVMSSGERQLLTMLYAVTKMSEDSLVLIDEPELSLHIDWQEELLGKMMGQLGSRQIIVCTHSPSIATDYHDFMIEISPDFGASQSSTLQASSDDEEELI